MGQVNAKGRVSPAEPLPAGARLLDRVARPLTGIEVRDAVLEHIRELTGRFTDETGLLPDFLALAERKLGGYSEINKMNIVYPGVGWHLTISREKMAGKVVNFWAKVVLDLARDKRREIPIGIEGVGLIDQTEEDEQLQSRVPDQVREARGLKVEADYVVPATGQRGKIQMARSVEVGKAAVVAPPVIEERADSVPSSAVEMPVEELVGEVPVTELKAKPEPKGRPPGSSKPRLKSYTTIKKEKDDAAGA